MIKLDLFKDYYYRDNKMLVIDFKIFYILLNFYIKILRIDLLEYIFKNKILLFNIVIVEC